MKASKARAPAATTAGKIPFPILEQNEAAAEEKGHNDK
jgi:hypothetical protein